METNNMTGKFAWRFIAGLVSVLAWAASAAAQTLVVGTGNPNIDVPAVQAAVNQGGEVVLRGHFSFDRPPTMVLPPVFQENGFPPAAMVLVSKAVSISGGDDGEMASIDGGTIPFYVEAPGAAVTIKGLHFVRPKEQAVLVYAVSGLVIASCKIESVEPWPNFGALGIEIDTSGNPNQLGKSENVSGTLLIVNNDIDMAGGTASDNTVGVLIISVGVPGAEVEAYVSGNTIRNTTERAIALNFLGGRGYVEQNVITTSAIFGSAHIGGCTGTDVIHVLGTGSYLVARNSIDSRWAVGGGIRVQGFHSPMNHAIVTDNDVNMEAPEGTVFDACSAGISIFGSAQDNVVLGNRIQGHARAALSVGTAGASANNAFVLNHLDEFKASLADIYVDGGIMNTLIVGQGTVEDHGIGTVIVPVADGGEGKDKNDH
jgi:hypothetical protein